MTDDLYHLIHEEVYIHTYAYKIMVCNGYNCHNNIMLGLNAVNACVRLCTHANSIYLHNFITCSSIMSTIKDNHAMYADIQLLNIEH